MLKFVHPRYWLTWLGFAFLWLISQLPWRWQMQLGKGLGLLLFALLSSRRQIACVNLAIAYPHLTQKKRPRLRYTLHRVTG